MFKNNPYELQKFIDAQNRILCGTLTMYQLALKEIRGGKKEEHWIWYIFPSIEGFSKSVNGKLYGIPGYIGAREYLNNQILHDRLVEISKALLNLETDNIREIMSNIDAMKIRACFTLFYYTSKKEFGQDSLEAKLFSALIDKYFFKIGFCEETIKILM